MKKDSYLMSMENEALEHWNDKIIKGVKRSENKKWLNHVRKYIDYGWSMDVNITDEEAKDKAMDEYILWVKAGNGDEWFLEDVMPCLG